MATRRQKGTDRGVHGLPTAPGYGQLLRTPGAWTFLLPGFAARQPFAMLTIGIVLLVQHTTGSYGSAGAVAAVTGVSMALFAPQSGKLADRFGQRAVLLPGVLRARGVRVGADALALADAPLWALFLAAVPTGASVPQVGPMVRARWAALLARHRPKASPLMSTAAAFESVTDEFTFVVGPGARHRPVHRRAPGGRTDRRGRTDAGRRPALRRAAPHPAGRPRRTRRTRVRTTRLRAVRPGRTRAGGGLPRASAPSSAACRSR